MVGHGRHVAGTEDICVGLRLQMVVDSHESLRVDRDFRACQPWRGAGLGDPEDLVEPKLAASVINQRVRHDLRHPGIGVHLDATLRKNPPETPDHASRMLLKDFTVRGKEFKRKFPGRIWLRGQRVMNRETKFHPSGAAADHADPRAGTVLANAFPQALPMPQETIDGFDRHNMVAGTADIVDRRRRSGIDGKNVVTDRRPVCQG